MAGTYTVRATKSGYLEGTVNVTISQATQVAPVLFMSPTGGTAFAFVYIEIAAIDFANGSYVVATVFFAFTLPLDVE